MAIAAPLRHGGDAAPTTSLGRWSRWPLEALRHPAATLFLVSVASLLPSLVAGVGPSHSLTYNLTWHEGFSGELQRGILYPRWLPDAFFGLGSPAFYFYPPLPFYLSAAVRWLTLDALSSFHVLALSALAAQFAAGLAMFAWLGTLVRRRLALAGAAAYIVAPYHLFCGHYLRGAYAEFTAAIFIPLVFLALSRLAAGRRGAAPGLAAAYALLLLSHLPTALLVTPFAVAFGLTRAVSMPAPTPAKVLFLAKALASATLGIAASALFVVPTLALQDSIHSDRFWSGYYAISNWFYWWPERWQDRAFMVVLIAIGCGWLAVSVLFGALALIRRGGRARSTVGRRDILFWLCSVAVAFVLLSGTVPAAWTAVPLLAKAQFPWRLLGVMEFAGVTLAVSALARLRPLPRWSLFATAVAFLPGYALAAGAATSGIAIALGDWSTRHRLAMVAANPDAGEYVPSTATFVDQAIADRAWSREIRQRLPGLPLDQLVPAERDARLRIDKVAGPALSISVDTPSPAVVVTGQFYFPTWRVEDEHGRAVAARPFGDAGLLSFDVPAGANRYSAGIADLPVIAWSRGVTIPATAILIVLAGLSFLSGRRTRRRAAAPASPGSRR